MFSRGRVDLRGDDDEFGPAWRRRRGRTRGARGSTSRATDGRAVHSSRTPSGRTPSGRTPSGRTPSARSLRRGLERTVSRATRRVLPDGSRGGARARDDGTRRIARGGDVRRVANPRRRRRVRTRRRRDESREGRRRRRRRSPAPETGVSSRPRRGRSGRRPEGARRVDPPDRGRSRRSNARAIGRPDHALRTRVARARPANDGHGESSSSSPSRRRFFAADARASPVRSAEGGNPGEHIRRSRGAISSGGGGRSGRENDRSRRARRSERSIGGSRETPRRRVAPRVFSHPRRGRGEKTVLLLEPGTHASRIRIGVTPTRIGTQRSAHVRGRVRGTPRTAPRARGGGGLARALADRREPRRRRREDGGGVGERVDATERHSFQHSGWFEHARDCERVSGTRTRVPAPAATKPTTTTGKGPGRSSRYFERRRVAPRRPPIGEHHVERRRHVGDHVFRAELFLVGARVGPTDRARGDSRDVLERRAIFRARARKRRARRGRGRRRGRARRVNAVGAVGREP